MLTLTVTVHPAIQGYNHLIVVQTIKKELLINNYCNILTDNCCFNFDAPLKNFDNYPI